MKKPQITNYTWEIAAEKIVAPVLLSAYYKKRIK